MDKQNQDNQGQNKDRQGGERQDQNKNRDNQGGQRQDQNKDRNDRNRDDKR
jgi:hypothetical protein